MNQRLLGLSWGISRFVLRLMPVIIISCFLTLECRSQSQGINSALSNLQQRQVSITDLDLRLMNLNIQRAYDKNDGFSAQPVKYDGQRQRFTTGFYVPSNSHLLRLPSKDLIETFEAEMNGLRLNLIRMLGVSDYFISTIDVSDYFISTIGMYIEADFVTYESPDFYVIARYKDGKIQLIREKLKSSK